MVLVLEAHFKGTILQTCKFQMLVMGLKYANLGYKSTFHKI